MHRFRFPAPGYLRTYSGAIFLLLAPLLAAGCDRGADDADPRVLELAHDTIRLENGRVVTVQLYGGAHPHIEPSEIRLSSGDVIRFTAADAFGHAVGFDAAALPQPARTFLERSGQLRSPPLVNRGTAWVVSFENAPAGNYPLLDLATQARATAQVADAAKR